MKYSLTTINNKLYTEINIFRKVKYVSMTNRLQSLHHQYKRVKTIYYTIESQRLIDTKKSQESKLVTKRNNITQLSTSKLRSKESTED